MDRCACRETEEQLYRVNANGTQTLADRIEAGEMRERGGTPATIPAQPVRP
jgi:hypothetical protein